MRLEISKWIVSLIPISMLAYAVRGNLTLIIITFLIILSCFRVRLVIEKRKRLLFAWGLFFLVFAFIGQCLRTLQFRPYLLIGYLFVVIFTFLKIDKQSTELLIKSLKRIAYIQAFGVFFQAIAGSVYYAVLPVFLISNVEEIRNRAASGYFTGFTREVSFTALFLVIGIFIIFSQIMLHKKTEISRNKKVFDWISLIIMMSALMLTGKRAQPIFCIAAILVAYFINSEEKLKLLKFFGYFVAAIIILIITHKLWINTSTIQRLIESIADYQMGASIVGLTNGRSVIYDEAIRLWNSNKLLGIGWGNFKYSTGSNVWFTNFDVHNCYLQVLCETGFIGAIVFYILSAGTLLYVIAKMIKKENDISRYRIKLFATMYIVFFFFYCITGTCLYEYSYVILFMYCILIFASPRSEKEKNRSLVR